MKDRQQGEQSRNYNGRIAEFLLIFTYTATDVVIRANVD